MSIKDISNRNFQSPLNFEFRIDRLPDLSFFIQKINIPSLTIGTAGQGANPLVNIPWPGDHMQFGELSIDFKMDEGMRNWFDIFTWMQSISFPERQSQYGSLIKSSVKNLDGKVRESTSARTSGDLYGQGILLINSSANNPQVAITFIDLHPVSLSEATFDTTDTNVTYVNCTATFKYDYYRVEKVG